MLTVMTAAVFATRTALRAASFFGKAELLAFTEDKLRTSVTNRMCNAEPFVQIVYMISFPYRRGGSALLSPPSAMYPSGID